MYQALLLALGTRLLWNDAIIVEIILMLSYDVIFFIMLFHLLHDSNCHIECTYLCDSNYHIFLGEYVVVPERSA